MAVMRKIAATAPLLGALWMLAGCMPTATSAGLDPNVANPITAGPQIGRCHMGGCSWFDIQSFEVVRETEDGALIRLKMRSGSSDHRDNAYPQSSRGVKIDWSPFSEDEHLFCSTRLPAWIARGESGGWEADRVDLLLSAGATEYMHNLYGHVCHPDGDLEAEGAAERLGYRRYEGEETSFALTSPEAIFDRLGR